MSAFLVSREKTTNNYMKLKSRNLFGNAVFCFLLVVSTKLFAQSDGTSQPDSIVAVTAEAAGLSQIPTPDLPISGTFWLVGSNGLVPVPLPCLPSGSTRPIYGITDSTFLVDGTGGQVAVNRRSVARQANAGVLQTMQMAVEAQVDAIANVIEQAQENQLASDLSAMFGSDTTNSNIGSENFSSLTDYLWDTNQLWLEVTNVSNGWSYLNLHNATNYVYAIWTTTNLLKPFTVEAELWPTDTNCQPFVLQNFKRQNLFVRAEDWTDVDSDGDGVPDWWSWQYFGTVNIGSTNLDLSGNGYTFAQDYSNNIAPTIFTYTGLEAPNNYVSFSQPTVQLDITGSPYYIATLIDADNFSNAVWNAYSGSTVTVNLGTSQGWHEVWVGLRGHGDDSTSAVWQRKRLKLDWTPPALFITNPTNSTVDVPMIQLQGYSPEALSRISYDLSNATGTLTNQQVLVLNQRYDTNTFEFTTNTFQAFDVVLTNGVNTFTLHAADLAGNVSTLVTNFTLDYSAKTNPPSIQITWPQAGVKIAGTSVSVRGQLKDATAAVTCLIMATNGLTNYVNGSVERNGRFWLDNLPLAQGSNLVTILVLDAAGNTSVTNFSLLQDDTVLTMNPPSDLAQLWESSISLNGNISDSTAAIWVNGVAGVNHGDGTWSADNVSTTAGGVAVFDLNAALAGGVSSATSTSFDKPPRLYVENDTQDINYYLHDEGYDYYLGIHHVDFVSEYKLRKYHHDWTDGVGGSGTWLGKYDGDGISDLGVANDHWQINGVFNWAATDWPQLTNSTSSTNGDTFLYGQWDIGFVPMQDFDLPLIQSEHCDISYFKEASDSHSYSQVDYKRTAQTKWKLQTGGKALPKQQNLFVVGGSATTILANFAIPPFVNLPTQPIPAQNIAIGSLGKLGSDGNLYVALPDNANLDVTPYVAGQNFYTFSLSAQKCKLHILANGYPLADDRVRPQAYYCVGQKLNFQAVFSPDPSGLNYTNPTWNYTADYVNNHWTDANDCEKYNIAPIPAMSNPTVAWFYNKQTQDATANLGLYCKFNNGQSVYLVRQGMFNVFTPSITFYSGGNAVVHVRHGTWFNINSPAVLFGIGNTDQTESMIFAANINSIPKFPGQAIGTQLVNRQASIDGIPFGTGGTNKLDNTEIYPNSQSSLTNDPANPHSNLLGTVHFFDQPGIPITLYTLSASGNDHFNTYFRFKPDGDSDNIYVTLGIANWDWHGNVDYTGLSPYDPWTLSNWTISGAGTVGPNFNPANDFPIWAGIYSNFP